jgi:hypothetical protein
VLHDGDRDAETKGQQQRDTIEVGSRSASTVAAGYHVGLGVDVALGPVLVGIESRYFSTIGQTFDGDVSLDGYLYAAKAGIRF